jgi:hypothetical protein
VNSFVLYLTSLSNMQLSYGCPKPVSVVQNQCLFQLCRELQSESYFYYSE